MNTGNTKILFVDDEQTTADTLALIFCQKGCNARAVYSAEQALEVISEWPPDLAILDVVLPGMHGIDLAVLLTRNLPNCRILLFSGQALTGELISDVEKKGYSFTTVAKPIHPLLLLDKALEALTENKKKSA